MGSGGHAWVVWLSLTDSITTMPSIHYYSAFKCPFLISTSNVHKTFCRKALTVNHIPVQDFKACCQPTVQIPLVVIYLRPKPKSTKAGWKVHNGRKAAFLGLFPADMQAYGTQANPLYVVPRWPAISSCRSQLIKCLHYRLLYLLPFLLSTPFPFFLPSFTFGTRVQRHVNPSCTIELASLLWSTLCKLGKPHFAHVNSCATSATFIFRSREITWQNDDTDQSK